MSDTRNPPAFPQQCADALDVGMVHEGMTLREWFAGHALAGLCACGDGRGDVLMGPADTARAAYDYADAMLAERARGEG